MKRLLTLAVLVCACAHSRWVEASGPYASVEAGCALVLPDGWMRVRDEKGLLATRDGPALQRIYTERVEFGKPLPAAKKTPTPIPTIPAAIVMPYKGIRPMRSDARPDKGTGLRTWMRPAGTPLSRRRAVSAETSTSHVNNPDSSRSS